MNNKAIYYKIVKKASDGFTSCWDSNPFKINYKIGEWAEPVLANSKIFVFKDRPSAEFFWNRDISWRHEFINFGSWSFFECEIGTEIEANEKISAFNLKSSLESYWSGLPLEQYELGNLPAGSIWTEKVKLTKEIKINEPAQT